MANPKLHKIGSAQCDLLVNAASRGDVTAVTRVLNADPLVYLKRDQGRALLHACVIAPNAVALLDLFHARVDTLFRGTTNHLAEMSFLHACRYGADVTTVQRLVPFLFGAIQPKVENGLRWAVKTRNGPLIEHLVTSYKPHCHRDYGALLCVAIETNDPAFVLRFMGMSVVQAFLASVEAEFDPCFIGRVAAHQKPHEWLVHAMTNPKMHVAVDLAAEQCPLVTADVALAHCAVTPTDAANFAHLCYRRYSLNQKIEAFHQAIQAGNIDVVGAMLEEVPALRRSRMDNDVSALMASSLAPNSIALLQCLRHLDVTAEAVHSALLHACQHGADAASTEFLWNWVELFNLTGHQRDAILWEGIGRATLHKHLAGVKALLPYVRDWTFDNAPDFLTHAMTDTLNDKFVYAVMEMPAAHGLFNLLDAKLARTAPASGADRCDCTDECECADLALSTVSEWINRALHYGMQHVAGWLETRWPALTRRHAFILCNSILANDAAQWTDLSQRYARDVTWRHTRDAYLVQRRFLPGLDDLGRHIATYLYVFDACNECNASTYRDPRPDYRHANIHYDSDRGCYYYAP